MGLSAFGQFEGADCENQCYTGILGAISLLFMVKVSFSRPKGKPTTKQFRKRQVTLLNYSEHLYWAYVEG